MKWIGWIAAIGAGLWAFSRGQEYSASEKLSFRVVDFDFPLPKLKNFMANLRALNSLAGVVKVEISNPSPTTIQVQGIYGDLLVNSTRIGRVQSVGVINMPGGSSSMHSIASTLYGGAFVLAAPAIVAKLASDGQATLVVKFDGIIRVAGVDIPYDQSSSFTLKTGDK